MFRNDYTNQIQCVSIESSMFFLEITKAVPPLGFILFRREPKVAGAGVAEGRGKFHARIRGVWVCRLLEFWFP